MKAQNHLGKKFRALRALLIVQAALCKNILVRKSCLRNVQHTAPMKGKEKRCDGVEQLRASDRCFHGPGLP